MDDFCRPAAPLQHTWCRQLTAAEYERQGRECTKQVGAPESGERDVWEGVGEGWLCCKLPCWIRFGAWVPPARMTELHLAQHRPRGSSYCRVSLRRSSLQPPSPFPPPLLSINPTPQILLTPQLPPSHSPPKAVLNLVEALDRNPDLYMRILERRATETEPEGEDGGEASLMGYFRNLLSSLFGSRSAARFKRLSAEEKQAKLAKLKEDLLAAYAYAHNDAAVPAPAAAKAPAATFAAVQPSPAAATSRPAVSSPLAAGVMPPPPPPPPLPPAAAKRAMASPSVPSPLCRPASGAPADSPHAKRSRRSTLRDVTNSGSTASSPCSPRSSVHALIRKEGQNKLRRTPLARSPGGTPQRPKGHAASASGGGGGSMASLFNTALLGKFRNVRTPSPGSIHSDGEEF